MWPCVQRGWKEASPLKSPQPPSKNKRLAAYSHARRVKLWDFGKPKWTGQRKEKAANPTVGNTEGRTNTNGTTNMDLIMSLHLLYCWLCIIILQNNIHVQGSSLSTNKRPSSACVIIADDLLGIAFKIGCQEGFQGSDWARLNSQGTFLLQ